MMSGLDPGELGFYGFRNRKDYSYDGYAIANASVVQAERVWDILSREGKKVILAGVPQTYPVKPINGCIVSDFLTPSTKHSYTYPSELKEEIERVADGYVLDVDNFRTPDKEDLLKRIYVKTEKHFRVAKHLISTRPWDFFMMVEMGVDRIQHGFWSYCDPTHRNYHRGNPFENCLKDYYRYLEVAMNMILPFAALTLTLAAIAAWTSWIAVVFAIASLLVTLGLYYNARVLYVGYSLKKADVMQSLLDKTGSSPDPIRTKSNEQKTA
jgi:predicted AlkP superfamily phosphohydrolase/phosphomutase